MSNSWKRRMSAATSLLVALTLSTTVSTHAASGKVWRGTIALPRPLTVNHETTQYVREGCAVEHRDGVFNALIDVSAYQGATLRFVAEGYDYGTGSTGWFVIKGTVCGPVSPGGATLAPQPPATEWTNSSPFLLIYFIGPAVNAHYNLEVIQG